MAFDIIIGAIQQTLLVDDAELTNQHFTGAFFHLAECEANMNPFVSEDWREIDASVLYARKEDLPVENHVARKSPRLKKSQ